MIRAAAGRLRVIGGSLRGRRLQTLRGQALRPTAERVREALFDILGARVRGATFLDAFAGTGAVGIEALSRGAVSATFVEMDPLALEILRKNTIVIAGLESKVRIMPGDLAMALSVLQKEMRRPSFDLVYVDPPYHAALIERGLRLVGESGLLRPDAIVVGEHESLGPVPAGSGLVATRTVTYGRTCLTFYRAAGNDGSDAARRDAG